MDRGERAIKFINNLTHTKGKTAKTKFNLRPWQQDIIRGIFSPLKEDGTRIVRTAYAELPRKNGKSELAAGIALYCLIGDGEEGAEVYSAAADRDQASLVFNVAAQMVRNDAFLSKRLKIIDSQKRIVDYTTGSFYRALSSDAHTKHGFNASALIYDEVHVAKDRELWDVLTTSMGAREQPLTFGITTAGYDKQSLCYELHLYAEKVLDGTVIDPTFFPVIYAAQEDPTNPNWWLDEEVWYKANPALGDFRGIEEMRMQAKRAKEIPAAQNTFKRLYLNVWTEAETRWIDGELWQRNAGELPDLTGRLCVGALDLASTTDIAAFGLLFPKLPEEGSGYWFKALFWIPKENIQKRVSRDKVPYDVWMRDGFLHGTSGNVIDYNEIKQLIFEAAEKYRIREIAYDRWNSSQLVNDLVEEGINMVAFGQGFASMAAPTREFEKLLLEGGFTHNNNPVLNWMSGNVVVKEDPAGNRKPDKSKSTEKIDGIVAAMMCLGRFIEDPSDFTSGYTADNGIVVL